MYKLINIFLKIYGEFAGPSGLKACVITSPLYFLSFSQYGDPLAANRYGVSMFRNSFSTIRRSMGRWA